MESNPASGTRVVEVSIFKSFLLSHHVSKFLFVTVSPTTLPTSIMSHVYTIHCLEVQVLVSGIGLD